MERLHKRSRQEISLLAHEHQWFKELLSPPLTLKQVNLSLSGGSKRTQYYNSFTFLNQNGTEPNQ